MCKSRLSLDDIEKAGWNPAPSPLDSVPVLIELQKGFEARHCEGLREQSLNGGWEMADGGYTQQRIDPAVPWKNSVPAPVPCSIHTALFEAGVIPDPMVGTNDKIALSYCYKEWWLKRTFSRCEALVNPRLCFDGVCYRAQFWLNGVYLGQHSGMFGGPEFDVSPYLKDENILIVKLDDAPSDLRHYSDYANVDEGWNRAVVINCVYGWHYACIPSRGIWAPVRLVSQPRVKAEKPFIAATDAVNGVVDLCLKATGENISGSLTVTVKPRNFEGETYGFTTRFESENHEENLHYQFKIPDPKLWWPLDHGEQNLYSMELSFCPDDDLPQYFCESLGLRTIKMAPLPGGPYEDKHNWILTVNGKEIFVKGTNWCTTDALLRFPDGRYDRFLSLAAAQHVQLLRAWGGGMPESDYFYDVCDQKGIMVVQEWPTCWDSQYRQPYDELKETVVYNMIRLRNHPSLIRWSGGNESAKADGPAMEMMAKLAYELDGSRVFHRTSPWGGGKHDYSSYWDMMDIDVSLQLESPFMGEFGMASAPNVESVMRYTPEEEKGVWMPNQRCAFTYHTPRFNEAEQVDMEHLRKHLPEFSGDETLEDFVWGTQMAQATAIRHTLESYRSRWPHAAGICYYKLTDVYPACSWSTIDYYGVPKLSYYVIADSYAPLHAAVLFRSTTARESLDAPVVLMDDAGIVNDKKWKVTVKAFDGDLKLIKTSPFTGGGTTGPVQPVGIFSLEKAQLKTSPLLITVELELDGEKVDGTFYWLNYRDVPRCLLNLPKTTLSYQSAGDAVAITNTGGVPAVGVSVECPAHDTEFVTQDSVFWLNPGETRTLAVNRQDGLVIKAWNAARA